MALSPSRCINHFFGACIFWHIMVTRSFGYISLFSYEMTSFVNIETEMHFDHVLNTFWEPLNTIWEHLNTIWEHLNTLWKHLNTLWKHLNTLWKQLQCNTFWKHLNVFWEDLNTFWKEFGFLLSIFKTNVEHILRRYKAFFHYISEWPKL